MNRIGREVVSGIAIFVAFIIFIFGFLYLKNVTFKAGAYQITIHFPDITGLEPGDKVSYAGLQVGKVKHFGLENGQVIVHAELNPEFKLPRDSRALIKSLGMVGEKFIDIVPGTESAFLQEGDRIEGAVAGDLTDITDSAGELMKQAEELLAQIQKAFANIFDHSSQNHLKESIEHLNEISKSINDNSGHLENTLINVESMSKNLNEMLLAHRQEMESSIRNFHTASNRFDDLTAKMDESLASVQTLLARIENQEGTAGKIIADEQLYNDIRNLTSELGTLVQDFKKRPQKYINFGFIKVF